MEEETYSSYRGLFKQSFTIPLGKMARFVGNVPIDFGHVATFFGITILIAVIYSVLLGNTTIFGLGRPIWSFLLAMPITYFLFRMDTVGQPLHLFLMDIVKFPFRKRWSVAFTPFAKPGIVRLTGKVTHRAVVSNGGETSFLSLPLIGIANKIEGLHLKTVGATRIEVNPLTKRVTIRVGRYDNINPLTQNVRKWGKTKIEIGRGEIRFLHRNGRIQAAYDPLYGKELK
ncbi:MAG TPA: hypothetical protein VJ824_15920 [Bacillota bacterium]|nr:hypothetical protein [Bacillota bacterium]